jgi:hypothetical protein
MQPILGSMMLFLLFGGLFVWMAIDGGIRIALKVYAYTLALMVWVFIASFLLVGK